ncbi:MAG: reverse transcriptase domain-containing protein, partial [Candidatus Thiodiazotropha sp.]
MSSAAYLSQCLNQNKIDICGISEHWLYEKDLSFLNQIDKYYRSFAVSDTDLQRPSNRRVGKGGVAFLWHIKHNNRISPLLLDDDRIIGIKYEICTDNIIFFFQTYLPCTNHSMDVYREYIDKLQNIISLYSERGMVVIMGDINTHLSLSGQQGRPNNRGMYFNTLLRENNMISVNTLELCRGADSTFVTYDGRFESLIDHIIIPIEKLPYVSRCEIIEDEALNVSRHRPVHCVLALTVSRFDSFDNQVEGIKINWRKLNQEAVNAYTQELENNARIQNSFFEGLLNSHDSIDRAYHTLVSEISAAARKCFPVKKFHRFLKPYWNQELGDFHKCMKLKRSAWVAAGKPRESDCLLYLEYKSAKREFRRCHRKCVNKYLQDQIDQIDKAAEVDSALFWRLVNARRKNSNSRPGSEMLFNGRYCNTSAEINKEWAHYFAELYTPTQADHFDDAFSETIRTEMVNIKRDLENLSESATYPIISAEEVESALKLTKRNKAGGDDGLMYEHLVYGGPLLCEVLSRFFNAVVKLSYAPKDMKRGVIITLFKGGGKRKDNPDNYRAITLSSVLLKLLERILLTRIELFDSIQPPLHPLQGGFRKEMGCMMTSFLVRESLWFAKENGSKVYACYLDIRKAFDQVWHDGLFYKLANCGIDKAILKVLFNLYTDMESCVRTETHTSDWFPILQGTRQGGVISPFLFLINTNELLWELDSSSLGISILNIKCGSPAVADDMLLMSFSKFGLDQMLSICYDNSCKWHIEYQPPKCTVVV